jgi:hypothetical protein
MECTRASMRRPRWWLGAAMSIALAAPSASDAGITGRWTSFSDWEYATSEMPDLDQGRGAGGGAFALPNNGFMYCGPTAGTNVLLYAMHHGSPGLIGGWSAPPAFLPHPGNWFSWRAGPTGDNPFYNHGGMNVSQMGGLMGTHAFNGTSFAGIYWGMRRALGPKFDVHGYLLSPSYTPNLTRVGQAGMERGAIMVVVGYYQVLGSAFGYPIIVRTGGHVMTLSRARRLGNNCWAWCRDPADDLQPFPPPAAVLTAQDNFRDRAFTAIDGWVLYAQPGFPLHFRWVTALLAPGAAPPGQVLILDGFITVRPRTALARKDFAGLTGPVPALQRIEASTWSDASALDEFILSPSGTEILDYTPFGAGAAVVMLTAPVSPGDPAQLWLVNQYTNESEMVGEIDGATALVAGMPPDVWVHAGERVYLVWLDPTEGDYPDGDPPGALLDVVTLPTSAELVRFDDYTRRLVAIDMDDRVVYVVAPAAPPVIETRALPADFPAGIGVIGDFEVLEDADGTFLASVDGSPMIVELDLTEPVTVTATIPVAEMTKVSDVAVADGRLFVSGDGQVEEFERNMDGDWVPVMGSDFAETEIEDSFRVVRSQTNFDPMLHEGDDFNNINPPDLVPGEPVPTCLGDLDLDGEIGLGDLVILLGRWGPVRGPFLYDAADLDPNFDIGFADLLILLSRWGPCPLIE